MMPKKRKEQETLPDDFLKKLKSIKAKRAKTVIDHVLKYGSITTEELTEVYGYDHPPRAIRDVKEQGIPIEKFTVKGKNNRSIAAYKFGDPKQMRSGIFSGRKVFPKQFKEELIARNGALCAICSTKFEPRYLQIDHCIPFEIAGETENFFMLLCSSCNRAKSWSCEHCLNWINEKEVGTCRCCYWSDPVRYTHVAMRLIRRLDITWTEHEVVIYEKIRGFAEQSEEPLPDFVKKIIDEHVTTIEKTASSEE
jgi:hypothetical protein